MPTGYTAAIKDGITFEQYALNCARAFGALIMMRDEPSDTPIPESFSPSEYHTEALQSVSDRLAQVRLMSPADADSAAQAEYAEALRVSNARRTEKQELRSKYDAMLAKVIAWQAPTADHVEYKTFMEKQILDSIEWDCRDYNDEPVLQSGAAWLADTIAQLEKNVAYHTREDAKERERTNSRNGWVKALRDSFAE